MGKVSKFIFNSNDSALYKGKEILFFIVIAYFFSVIVRLLLLFTNNISHEMVLNPDGYLYANYATNLLHGKSYPLTSEYMAGYLLYFIHKITNLDISIIMFYLPAFTSSLIVAPIILLGRLFKQIEIFFFASLFTSISIGYYSRTYIGYYDTDQLNLFFPLLILLSMVGVIKRQNIAYIIVGIASIFLYQYWYHSHKAILFAIVIFYMIYVLLFTKNNKIAKFSTFYFAIALLNSIYKVEYVLSAMAIFTFLHLVLKNRISEKILTIILAALVLSIFTVGSVKYSGRFMQYVNKENAQKIVTRSGDVLKFKSALATVSENQNTNLELLSTYVIGNIFFFILGTVGFLIVSYFYRAYLLFFPLLLIGLLSLKTGVRFTYYTAFPVALGLFNILIYIKNFLYIVFSINEKIIMVILKIITILLAIYILNSNVFYKVPVLIPKNEYKSLEKLSEKEKISNKDYIFAWWDYGWPLQYLTGANIVVDNGRNDKDNYFISKTIFAKNGKDAYQNTLFTIDSFIDARKKGYEYISDYIFKKLSLPVENLDNYILNHKSKYNNRKYYVLFDDRYLNILETIYTFSNYDLKNGETIDKNLILVGYNKKCSGNNIYFNTNGQSNIMVYEKGNGVVHIDGNHIIKISKYINANMRQNDKVYRSGDVFAIDYKDYFIIISKSLFNSYFIQAHIFRNIDKKYFKIVSSSDDFIVLKLLKGNHAK